MALKLSQISCMNESQEKPSIHPVSQHPNNLGKMPCRETIQTWCFVTHQTSNHIENLLFIKCSLQPLRTMLINIPKIQPILHLHTKEFPASMKTHQLIPHKLQLLSKFGPHTRKGPLKTILRILEKTCHRKFPHIFIYQFHSPPVPAHSLILSTFLIIQSEDMLVQSKPGGMNIKGQDLHKRPVRSYPHLHITLRFCPFFNTFHLNIILNRLWGRGKRRFNSSFCLLSKKVISSLKRSSPNLIENNISGSR